MTILEIDVTDIILNHTLTDYSDSAANSGRQDIGAITWRNACTAIEELNVPLVPETEQDTLRDWILGFGAWDEQEVEEMTDVETQALLLQFVAGDGQTYLEAVEDGRPEPLDDTGRLYETDDGWFIFTLDA